MDKFTALKTLICVADLNSFSQAAQILGKTPSAITKIIAGLERESGASLFERNTRRVQLTEAGHLLYQAARKAVATVDQATEDIAHMQHQLTGDLRIAAPIAYGAAFLNIVCARFSKAYPHIRLQVTLSDDDRKILDGGHDLALHEGDCNVPGLISKIIGRNEVVMVASPEYIKGREIRITRDCLSEHFWLVYWHPLLSRHHWHIRKDDQVIRLDMPEARILSDNFDLLISAAIEGTGILHAPIWSISTHLIDGRLELIEPGWIVDPDAFGPHILAVYPSHRRDTKKIKVFIEFVIAQINQISSGIIE